jgi:hypothetical protein
LLWTRSQPYRKNDQAWVEQKNGAVVRRLAGNGRLSGLNATATLERLYQSARLYVNFLQAGRQATRWRAGVSLTNKPTSTRVLAGFAWTLTAAHYRIAARYSRVGIVRSSRSADGESI